MQFTFARGWKSANILFFIFSVAGIDLAHSHSVRKESQWPDALAQCGRLEPDKEPPVKKESTIMKANRLLYSLCLIVCAYGSAGEKPRMWRDSTGEYSVQAQLLRATQSTVQLRTETADIELPISKLSEADQKWLFTGLNILGEDEQDLSSVDGDIVLIVENGRVHHVPWDLFKRQQRTKAPLYRLKGGRSKKVSPVNPVPYELRNKGYPKLGFGYRVISNTGKTFEASYLYLQKGGQIAFGSDENKMKSGQPDGTLKQSEVKVIIPLSQRVFADAMVYEGSGGCILPAGSNSFNYVECFGNYEEKPVKGARDSAVPTGVYGRLILADSDVSKSGWTNHIVDIRPDGTVVATNDRFDFMTFGDKTHFTNKERELRMIRAFAPGIVLKISLFDSDYFFDEEKRAFILNKNQLPMNRATYDMLSDEVLAALELRVTGGATYWNERYEANLRNWTELTRDEKVEVARSRIWLSTQIKRREAKWNDVKDALKMLGIVTVAGGYAATAAFDKAGAFKKNAIGVESGEKYKPIVLQMKYSDGSLPINAFRPAIYIQSKSGIGYQYYGKPRQSKGRVEFQIPENCRKIRVRWNSEVRSFETEAKSSFEAEFGERPALTG